MTTASYKEKFDRIAPQTPYDLLDSSEQELLRQWAFDYRFTMQELKLVGDIALDRLRWKEQKLSEVWAEGNSAGSGSGYSSMPRDKSRFLNTLRDQHRQLGAAPRQYAGLSRDDKPKTEKPRIETRVKPRLGLGRCPVASEKTRCCNLMTLDAVEKCGFDCSYCSIQSFYHGNKVTFDETFADKLKALELDPAQTWHIGTGQSSDSLMWGNHKGVLDALGEFAGRNPNVILELKTKSKNIGWLLENDYPPNIICTWSLNPQLIIDHEEHLSASLEQRLQSAERIAAKGRLVGFHFHPIMQYQGWQEGYRKICEQLVERFDPGQVALVSMGTLTFTRSVMKTIRNRPLISKILQMPMEEIAGKFSYPLENKVDMFGTVYNSLDTWHDKVFFYLCMEAQSLWMPVFGYEYQTNLELESAMKQAYLDKIAGLENLDSGEVR